MDAGRSLDGKRQLPCPGERKRVSGSDNQLSSLPAEALVRGAQMLCVLLLIVSHESNAPVAIWGFDTGGRVTPLHELLICAYKRRLKDASYFMNVCSRGSVCMVVVCGWNG